MTPPFLLPGNKVALISVAGKINQETVFRARQLLEQENYSVEVGEHALGSYHQFSGTDAERAADMQKALDDPDVKAIFFTRGGYGSLRTFQLLDWSGFLRYPKWLVGFSDITVFHAYLSSENIASVHGVMNSYFFENETKTGSFDQLMKLLRGNSLQYSLEPHPLNRKGIASGTLIGGNLSILMSLRGTPLDQSFDGKILFIEDISEFDYHYDRMMVNLKFGNKLANLTGLVAGYFTDTKSSNTPFGKSVHEIILEAVDEYRFPVIFNFPAGHELPCYPLMLGLETSISVTNDHATLHQPL